MHKLRELLAKYLNKSIDAGNHAYFAEMAGSLSLKNWHEGRRAAYDEFVADLKALLEKMQGKEASP